jgi:hypothetical protein
MAAIMTPAKTAKRPVARIAVTKKLAAVQPTTEGAVKYAPSRISRLVMKVDADPNKIKPILLSNVIPKRKRGK